MVVGFLSLAGLWTRVSLALFAVGSLFVHTYKYSYGHDHHPPEMMVLALFSLALSPAARALDR